LCASTAVGDTHPVGLEAMVASNCMLVNDRANAEIARGAALLTVVCEGTGRGLCWTRCSIALGVVPA
jgi:hypothetical protein